MIVVPTPITIEILDSLIAAGGEFDGALVRLFQNDIQPTKDSILADFTIATFTGFATSAAIVWAGPILNPDGEPIVIGDLKLFTGGSPFTVSNTIYGYYIVDAAGTKLLWSERFALAQVVAAAGQSVQVVPTFGARNQAA